jgi:hypothetical protein
MFCKCQEFIDLYSFLYFNFLSRSKFYHFETNPCRYRPWLKSLRHPSLVFTSLFTRQDQDRDCPGFGLGLGLGLCINVSRKKQRKYQ